MKSVIALVLSLVSVSAMAAPKLEAGTYAVDAAHSKVGFEISHLVISTVEGRFDTVTGEIVMGKKVEDMRINANIDVASVSTGNADRDKHLKSPDFFDAAKFPQITFVSKSVSGPTDSLTVKGEITIHGVTKPITLLGKYTGSVVDPYGNTKIAFSGKGTLSRKAFGLVWNKAVEAGPVVGDEVTIDLRIEAGKPAAKK
jgi:polyisoprenoid-binding protein YceI